MKAGNGAQRSDRIDTPNDPVTALRSVPGFHFLLKIFPSVHVFVFNLGKLAKTGKARVVADCRAATYSTPHRGPVPSGKSATETMIVKT